MDTCSYRICRAQHLDPPAVHHQNRAGSTDATAITRPTSASTVGETSVTGAKAKCFTSKHLLGPSLLLTGELFAGKPENKNRMCDGNGQIKCGATLPKAGVYHTAAMTCIRRRQPIQHNMLASFVEMMTVPADG